MNFKQLETFINVVEWDSFSEAAKRLYLTQPTISTHIRQLETELNIKLIQRTTKKLMLTEQGKEFYRYAKSISRIVESMEDAFSQSQSNTLTIGCSSLPANYILPEVLKNSKIKSEFSKINVTLGDSQSTVDGILNGSLNIGIVGFTSMNKDLKFDKFFTDKLVIITENSEYYRNLRDKKVSTTELLNEPMLVREQGSGTRKESLNLLDTMGISKNNINIVATINDAESIKKHVKAGLGISIVNSLSVEEDVKDGSLLQFPINEIDSTRNFYFVYRNNYILSNSIKELIKTTKKLFEER